MRLSQSGHRRKVEGGRAVKLPRSELAWSFPRSSSASHELTVAAFESMDSPAITSLFRQLFTTRARQCLRSRSLQQCAAPAVTSRVQRRSIASNRPESVEESIHRRTSNWHPRLTSFPEDKIADVQKYPTVTARDLRMRRQRPKRVKMLMRDFIEGRFLP